ncbi:hypothetical protein JG688_00007752, partial [Phytophthora aleatoria]
ESGWLCAHILAALKHFDEFDLHLLVRSTSARKPPGWPWKTPKTTHNEDPYIGQYSVPKLIQQLADHPGSVIGWKVLTTYQVTSPNDDVSVKQRTGVIRPWIEEEEKYFWEIEFDRRANESPIPDAKLDITQLAEVINFTRRARYPLL